MATCIESSRSRAWTLRREKKVVELPCTVTALSRAGGLYTQYLMGKINLSYEGVTRKSTWHLPNLKTSSSTRLID